MNRPIASVLIAVTVVALAFLSTHESRSQSHTDDPLEGACPTVPSYSRPCGDRSEDQDDRVSPWKTELLSEDPLCHPLASPLAHVLRERGTSMSDEDFEHAVEKACIAFLHAAEATELEREAKRREEAGDAALHRVARSLLEVTKAHPRTRAAAKAQKAFEATGLVVLESGTIYDPETTCCFGGLVFVR